MYEFKRDTNETLYSLDNHAKKTDERLNNIEKIIEPLPSAWEITKKELQDHEKRITHLEKQA